MDRYDIKIFTVDGSVDEHKNIRFEVKNDVIRINNYGVLTCYPLCNVKNIFMWRDNGNER